MDKKEKPAAPPVPRGQLRQFYVIVQVFELLREAVKYGAYVTMAYFAYESVRALAGLKTEASMILGYFTSSEPSCLLPWMFVAVALVYAGGERRLRMRKTEYLQERVKALELRLDPKRTSSHLLPTGETKPEDDFL